MAPTANVIAHEGCISASIQVRLIKVLHKSHDSHQAWLDYGNKILDPWTSTRQLMNSVLITKSLQWNIALAVALGSVTSRFYLRARQRSHHNIKYLKASAPTSSKMEGAFLRFHQQANKPNLMMARPSFHYCGRQWCRQRNMSCNRYDDGPVVISGISGRFPIANSIKELTEKLLKGHELTSETTSRWSSEKLPKRFGFLDCLDKFDAGFFNLTPRQGNLTDPQIRLLLEAAFEAIIDAGMSPLELRGSRTGVFCGASGGSEAADYRLFHYNLEEEGHYLTAASSYMIPARIAFHLDLQGPSCHVSSACSTSLTAIETALNSLRSGKCDAAIVTGSQVQLNPLTSKDLIALKALAPDGRSKTFDESADGYARAEAVVAILIQKEADARRNYARILGVGSSTDGFKHAGIMHPTRFTQSELLKAAYEQVGLDPANVSYVEAHGTGTLAGDPEEIHAIHRTFCEGKKREQPLLVGSLKTNMGHSECAAGLSSVAKIVGMVQSGTIPANLNFNEPNPEIKSLFDDGSLKVVTERTPFNGGVIGISSLGIGGTNYHLILDPGPKNLHEKKGELPALLPISGRSDKLVRESIAQASEHADCPEFVHLLQNAFGQNIPGHGTRGFGLIHTAGVPENGPTNPKTYVEVSTCEPRRARQVWVVFPGMGSQWSGMARDLLKIEPFAESIHKSRMTLKNLGVDLDKLLDVRNQSIFRDIEDAFIGITVMQMALWDTLKELQITPHGFVGHSVGECLCAYADGCLTAEETLQLAHARGRAMKETQKVVGGMSSIGMSDAEIQPLLPPRVQLACHNAPNNVTISGEYELLTWFTTKLQGEGKLAVPVNSCGVAAHSSFVHEAGALFRSYAGDIIKGDRPRSSRWISTSIPEAQWASDLGKFASPEYFENNLVQPVLFCQAMQHVQAGSVVIEVSPKGFFQALLSQTVPNDCVHIAPMTPKADDDDDKLWHFFQSIGKMYNAGLDIKLDKLYAPVSTPVSSNVPSLSHLVKWDHEVSWRTSVLNHPLEIAYESAIDIEDPSWTYLAGHKIDNVTVMPASGLLCGVWNHLGDILGRDYENLPVQFKNVTFKRAIILNGGEETTIVYRLDSKSGVFTIENQNEIVASGTVEVLTEELDKRIIREKPAPYNSSNLVLTKQDVYKKLRLRSYNFTGLFQGIQAMDGKGRWADICWNGNWTCLLEAALQSLVVFTSPKHLTLPVAIQKLTIDPVEFKKNSQKLSARELGSSIVRVVNLPNQKKVVGPGIEITGLESRITPRKPQRANLSYESYTFSPFFKHSEGTLRASLEEMLDLVLENSRENYLEVADVFSKKENSLACAFQRILAGKPLKKSTVTLITLEKVADKLEDSDKVESVVVAKETTESLTPQVPSDIVLLDDPSLVPLVVPAVKANGFVLVHYSNEEQAIILNQELGLQKCSSRLAEGKTLDLYRKVQLEPSEIVHVSVDSPDFAWVPELQRAISSSKESKSKIFVTSQGDPASGILGLVKCLRLEDGGERIRCILDPQGQLSLNFKRPDQLLTSIIANDLFVNVCKNNGELGTYSHVKIRKEGLEAVNSVVDEAFIGMLTPTDLSSFRWIESPLQQCLQRDSNSSSDQNIPLKRYKVAYAPINYRDVLLATGAIPLEPHLSYSGPYLGYEFAGFDEQGQRVMGLCHGNGLATSVMADPRYVWEVPDNWTLEEAATIPIAYATVLYAFHTRTRLQPAQTVLIHSGTGGVGQAAISVALAHGCKIFTTVGTPQKREFIKKIFPQITDDYIGNSSDTSFEAQVMELTEGRGVDVALNSLSGDKLMATVRCVAQNGTFLQTGILDPILNTEMGLKPLLENINVCGVGLHHAIHSLQGYDQVLRQFMYNGIRNGTVKPLPRSVFECNQAEEAFWLMASGKHMGKLVVKVRDEDSKWNEPLKLPTVIKRSYFLANNTYLIVGGLGGLGMEVAGWMVERGARKLILSSRSGVTNGYQELRLRGWRDAGVEVEVLTQDLSNKSVVERVIGKVLAKGGILGGIFNSALQLRDDEFLNQTIEDFQQVSKSKECITKVLDGTCRKLCPDLEYFVAFSSLACGRGNVDQSNYGWANSSMEQICEKRREDGLHGLAIQWGILGQVGVVAEKLTKGMEEDNELQGLKAQSLHSCLEVLDAALQQPFPVVSSCVIAEKGTKKGERTGLLARVEKIFGIPDFTAIPTEKKLSELGLDSLVSIQLKQLIEREHQISLSKEQLQNLTVGDVISINRGTYNASKEL